MRGIFYLTFNGVVNNTNGIGTQTKLLLSGFDFFYDFLKKKYGDISLNIITPAYPANYPGYSNEDCLFSDQKIKKLGGNIFFCKDSKTINDFWTTAYWNDLSIEASEIIKREALNYDEIIVICIDTPFLQMPIVFKGLYGSISNIKWLLTLYSSSYIHDKNSISLNRLAWEYVGMSASRLDNNVYLASVCKFMENHLIDYYGAPKERFAPYESSIFLQSNDFVKLQEREVMNIIEQYKIPLDKEIIFCFGRGVWIKGFDMLINSLCLIKKDIHLVIISVPPQSEKSEYQTYQELLSKVNNSYTIIPAYTRILPKALCQWRNTKVVVCPSRGEPFSNIPLETSIWAKVGGPIILASNIDGFVEQISNGINGYLFEVESIYDLANNIDKILSLESNILNNIRQNAYEKVIKERDFLENIEKTLDYFWANNM